MFFLLSFLLLVGVFVAFLSKRQSFLFFVVFVLIVPTSTGTSFLNVKEGVFFYDFAIILMALIIFMGGVYKKKIGLKKSVFIYSMLLIVLIAFSLYLNGVSKYLIKDFRPFIAIYSGFIFWAFYKDLGDQNKNWFALFALISAVSSLFNVLYLVLGINVGVGEDAFYEANSYRYLDATTYFSCFFLITFTVLFSKKLVGVNGFLIICLLLSLINILIGNSRFMVLSLLVSMVLAYGLSIVRVSITSVVAILIVFAFFYLSNILGADRVVDSLDLSVLNDQLNSRFLPVIMKFDQAEWFNYIFGFMLGDPFFIPWFEYRESIDPFNANIDGLYGTYFTKLGVFFLIPIYMYISSVLGIGRIKTPYVVFMLMMFLVSSTPYQIYAIGLMLGGFFSYLSYNELLNAKK